MFRFHVVSLPHTQTNKKYVSCAYTQKVLNFCKMMKSLGHTVYHYGGEGSEAECDEHIDIITNEERQRFFGGNDWTKEFYAIQWDSSLEYWETANNRAIEAIKSRIEQKDFICLIGGNCQKKIADAFPDHLSVEFGIGYEGVFSRFRVFESYAWMHYIYGKMNKPTGDFYDQVIPNYFDPMDFPLPCLIEKKDYAFFIGRLIPNKGIEIAVEACRRAGIKLIVAGQGGTILEDGSLQIDGGQKFSGDIEYVGTVNAEERFELMRNARCTFVPTMYVEPFGGVNVEAQFSGCPVITTDRGAFTETVKHGVTGFRCRTLAEFTQAIKDCDKLDPLDCSSWARQNYSIDNVRHKYEKYFEQLHGLRTEGFYN